MDDMDRSTQSDFQITVDLFRDALRQIKRMMRDAPEAIVRPETEEESADLVCPRCGSANTVQELDWGDYRCNLTDFETASDGEGYVLGVSDGDRDYHVLARYCGECEGFLRLPTNVEPAYN